MADQFFLLPCQDKKCAIATALPLRSLQDVIQHRRPPATDTDFVNFACPHCGLGSVHHASNLKPTPATSSPVLVRLPLYCAFLRCDNPRCEVRVTVHTTARIGDETYNLTTASRSWKVGALECVFGHRAKQPIELVERHVFAPEGN